MSQASDVERAEPLVESPVPPAHPGHSRRYIFTAAGVVALGSAASILSSTVVNVAVPDLQATFHAGLTDVQWILTAYLLGLSTVIPISGYVSDRFGTKRVYLVTLVAFTIASGLCGLAWNLQSEIAFRVIQGLAGGMVMPVGMTIIMRMAAPDERGRLMSILGVPLMLAPALGPTVGGWLIQVFDWRWVFWVNLPAGILALVLGFFFLEAGRMPWVERKVDVVGLFLATPGVALVIYGLTQAAVYGWSSWEALLPLAGGVLLVVGFVSWELRQEHPLLDMKVFRDAGFAASMVVGVIFASALFGAVFLIPVFMQEVQGKDTLQAGLLLAPQGLAAAAAMTISGTLSDRFGARPIVFSGILVLVAATLLLVRVTPATDNWSWILITSARGIGMGFAMMPNFAAAYVTLPQAAIARATALSNTLQRVSSSFGIAVLATIVEGRIAAHLPTHQAIGAGAHLSQAALAAAARAAAAKGFDDTFWVAAGIAGLALPASLLLRRPIPEGERVTAERGGDAVRHPDLSPRLRAAFLVLLVASLAFLAFTIAKTVNAF
ncbi:MAG TPA: DHA2 family efflux MFS transporter permease subunit [Candidatus Dormibacteraeota bacterium]